MKNYKISVIIPCYSVGEEFLNEALESITNQTYENWEIILVDDCSPKEEWKSEKIKIIPKEKIKVINNKENLYAAQSRNIGLENSKGEIVLFLDADDKYIDNNFFDYLIENFEKNPNLDLIVFQYTRDLVFKKNKLFNISENYYSKITMKEYIRGKDYFISPCFEAISKKFLEKNKIKFLNNKNKVEDWIFCYQIFISKPNVLYTNKIFYFYRKRINSTTFNLKENKKRHHMDLINSVLKDIEIINLKKGGGTNFYTKETKTWFLTRTFVISILIHGRKNNKIWINSKFDKKDIKKNFYYARSCEWKTLNFFSKYKLKWLLSLIIRVIYFLKK